MMFRVGYYGLFTLGIASAVMNRSIEGAIFVSAALLLLGIAGIKNGEHNG